MFPEFRRAVRVAALATLVAAAPLAAAPAVKLPPYTLEHALTLRSISGLTWSRDGSKLAFVVTEQDTAENATNQDVWLADFARGGEPRRLTRHPKNDFMPTFSAGGDTIAFIGNRGTGDDARAAIWMLSLQGGEPWAYGSTPEGVSEVQWSPDGRFLAWVMADTLPKRAKEWQKKKWDHVVEDERLQWPRLWVTELATGKQRQLTSGPLYLWNVRWSPDSKTLAFLTSPTGKVDDGNAQDVGLVPVAGGAVKSLGVIGNDFAWSPAGDAIAVATTEHREVHVEKTDLWLVPVANGAAAGAPRKLTANYDEDAKEPDFGPDGRAWFLGWKGASTRWVALGRDGAVSFGADLGGDGTNLSIASNGRAAWTQSRSEQPNEVWVAERPGEPGRALTSLNAAVSKLALGETRTVTWRSKDGTPIEGVLLRPRGLAKTAKPKTLLLIHGGPYASRYSLGFLPLQQFFVAHGYQILMPNFRSSGGYGTAFMVRKRADWGGQDYEDVMSGVDSLVAWGLADPARLGVYGHSYGGHLTNWIITQTNRFKAAVSGAGAVDYASFVGQSDTKKYRAFEFEGWPWENPDGYRRISPITYVANVKTPTLVQVGEQDVRVPYPQSQQLYTALQALGVPSAFVHYPREPHGPREYRHRWDWQTRQLAWFDRWIP